MKKTIIGGVAAAVAALGIVGAAPASADPSDLGHQICGIFDQQGLTLGTLLGVLTNLSKSGFRGPLASQAVTESVAADCPKYEPALAAARRQESIESSRIPNGGPGYGYCASGYYNPLRGDCEVTPYVPPQPGY